MTRDKRLIEVEMAALRRRHAATPLDDPRSRPAHLLTEQQCVELVRRAHLDRPPGAPHLAPDQVERAEIEAAWRELAMHATEVAS